MKTILRILISSIIVTITFIVTIVLISKFIIPQFALHLTYPIRLLRGTEIYEGESRNLEVFLIYERIVLPTIFVSSAIMFFLFRKKLRLQR
jgi:hypothetical protein